MVAQNLSKDLTLMPKLETQSTCLLTKILIVVQHIVRPQCSLIKVKEKIIHEHGKETVQEHHEYQLVNESMVITRCLHQQRRAQTVDVQKLSVKRRLKWNILGKP